MDPGQVRRPIRALATQDALAVTQGEVPEPRRMRLLLAPGTLQSAAARFGVGSSGRPG